MIKIKSKKELERTLNAIYSCYVTEDDAKLDENAMKIKECFAFVIDELVLMGDIEIKE